MEIRKPNLFVIGLPKAGTTALYCYFKQHSDIFVTEPKELTYFCNDLTNINRKNIIKTKKEFLSHYNNVKSQKVIANFCGGYVFSKKSPKEIQEFNPKAKIIVIIREPVSFFLSKYNHLLRNFNISMKFEEFINADKSFKKELLNYPGLLKNYLRYFPNNQIKVILFEEFKNNNQQTIDEITDFLNVNKIKVKEVKVNKGIEIKHHLLRKLLVEKIRANPASREWIPYRLRVFYGEFVDWLTGAPKKNNNELIDKELQRKIKHKFKPVIVKLNNLLHDKNLLKKEVDLVKIWRYKDTT
jgi:hypothetical protein